MIHFVALSDEDFNEWRTAMWADYRSQLLGAGFTPEEISLNVAQFEETLFVDGVPNGDQHIFDVMDDETKVGILWLATRVDRSPGEWFVYDIVIDREFRSKGYGRSTMQAAEDYVKSHGGTRLALNVFGPNVVARSLYESLGYATMTIGMRKDLV